MKISEIIGIVEMVLSVVEAVPAVLEQVKATEKEFRATDDDKEKAHVVIDGLEAVLTLLRQEI